MKILIFLAFVSCISAHKKSKRGGIYWGEIVSGYDLVHHSSGFIPAGGSIPMITNMIFQDVGDVYPRQNFPRQTGTLPISPDIFPSNIQRMLPSRIVPRPFNPERSGIYPYPDIGNGLLPMENFPFAGGDIPPAGKIHKKRLKSGIFPNGGQHVFPLSTLPINPGNTIGILPEGPVSNERPVLPIHRGNLPQSTLGRPVPLPTTRNIFPGRNLGLSQPMFRPSGTTGIIPNAGLTVRDGGLLPNTNFPSVSEGMLPAGQFPVQNRLIPPSIRLSQLWPGPGLSDIYFNKGWPGINPNTGWPIPGPLGVNRNFGLPVTGSTGIYPRRGWLGRGGPVFPGIREGHVMHKGKKKKSSY